MKRREEALEKWADELMDKMTLEEMILQTDQYFSRDFVVMGEDGLSRDVDMEKADALLKGSSVGSIQTRDMTPGQLNRLQEYAVKRTRLGIPFLFSEEALHGLLDRRATSFPQQIGLAATFEPELGRRMGRAIGTETRAMGIHETYSPVMDLIRDPRYGRTEESYGEDTCLCASFARAVVEGLQNGDISAPDAVAAEPKHYAGYGAPVGGLNCAPCAMGRHEVFSDCLPVFEAAYKDAGATDAMCSYNAIDGMPVAADHELLTDVLRGQWGMPGFVRSDLTAVERLYDNHFMAATRQEAMAMGLEAGVDLQLYDFPHEEWQTGLKELVESGRLDIEVIRRACGRVLKVKKRLGLFERPYVDESRMDKYVHCEEHVKLALDIARRSMTLLKNEGDILPLSKDIGTVAVLGPAAGMASLGDYSPDGKTGVSVAQGVRAVVSPGTKVLYDRGCFFQGDAPITVPSDWLVDDEGMQGLTGRYYNAPVPEGEPVLVRRDRRIDFNWIMSKPHGDVDADVFSVLWTGKLVPGESFDGYLGFDTQDSMRLYVDGELILDGWGEKKEAGRTVPFAFEKGRAYKLRIEFTNDRRGARVVLGYQREREDFSRGLDMARQADAVILCMGDDAHTCGENLDRTNLDLPGRQEEFVRAVAKMGKPTVLVLLTGRPVSCAWEEEHIPAILEAWFPGEMGGQAVAETLFGDNEPTGRLPISFPRHVGQIPCHYTRRPGGGRRYVEMDWLPLYPFGYGLSYTTFEVGGLTLDKERIRPGEEIHARVRVKNTGKRPGTAAVELYIRDMVASVVKPLLALAAFGRVRLLPGEEKVAELTIGERAMRTLGPDFVWRVEKGEFQVILARDAEHPVERKSFWVEG